MTTVDNIRNHLIDKILTIRNKEFLIALDRLISSSSESNEIMELTKEQELMLKMSEEDIVHKRIISQDDLKIKTNAWLKSREL